MENLIYDEKLDEDKLAEDLAEELKDFISPVIDFDE